jgi:2-keto-4-pentenoate hydratase/2-oxohepta-3-ene-1,7-dioic acid hydratase in catechol pathway
MKLATYSRDGDARIAAVDTARGALLDLAGAATLLDRADPTLASMQALIDGGADALDRVRAIVDAWPDEAAIRLADARLLSPLPVPLQMRDCLVFEEHLVNARRAWSHLSGTEWPGIPDAWYQRPSWYKCNRFSVVGTETEVCWPDYSELMDFELELACVLGRGGTNIRAADAASHVFGFTIFNDFSARDLQLIERPLGLGPMKSKDFNTGNVLGPWIVTPDEFADPNSLDMEARVNGERWGGGNSASMHHSFATIIEFISRSETLHAGEIICSGTVGTGCGLEQERFLSPNDVVELEIEGIGILRNRIVRDGHPAPKGA